MYGKIASAALIGLSAVSGVAARPMASGAAPSFAPVGSAAPVVSSAMAAGSSVATAAASGWESQSSVIPSKSSVAPLSTGTGSSMSGHSYSNGTQKAFKFPLSNGFPNIKNPSSQLSQIEQQALGTLPNGKPPLTVSGNTTVSLGFVAFNELFEVAFFSELIQNITENKPGYDQIANRDYVLRNLQVILAQEELHELNANFAFNNFAHQSIQPCKYDFPVDNFYDAIKLASTFTDVVLSTIPDIQTVVATAGDIGLVRGLGSVIGQEGEQNGFYREILKEVPSQLPFLTGGARDFAFSAILQNFVVPGSCPSQSLLQNGVNGGDGLIEFGKLNVLTKDLSLKDVTAQFSAQTVDTSNTHSWYKAHQSNKLYVTYINQQNTPVSVPVEHRSFSGSAITFTASFPGASKDLNGLTIAAVTNTAGPFSDPAAVAADTVFGPGLIEIN